MTIDPVALIAIVLALGLGGIVKGVTGMGLPLIAVPALASFLGVPHAIALLMVPVLVTNVWQIASHHAVIDRSTMAFLVPMLAAGAFGVAGGTALLVSLDERLLSLGLAALLLAYVGLRLAKPHFKIGERVGRIAAAPVGLAAGVLQGATGISAPLGVTFIHAMRFGREAHVFAVSAMFLIFAMAQAPALAFAGILTWQRLFESAFALIPVLALMPVGQRLASRFSRVVFDRVILLVLAATAAKMIVEAWLG